MEPKICPYLGLKDDPNSNKDFPFEGNTCYRAKRPVQVALSHQRSYCLCDEHTHCPGYIDGWAYGFPDSLRAFPPTYKRALQNKWVWAVFTVFLLVGVYFIFQEQINTMVNDLGRTEVSQLTEPQSTAIPESASIPTRTASLQPIPTSTSASVLAGDTSGSTTADDSGDSPNSEDTGTISNNTSASAVTATPTPALTSSTTETRSEPTEPQPYLVEVITTALNIRSEPVYKADGSNILERLVQGEIIEVFDEQKGWLLTEKGWIFKAYTRKVVD
jgi:hypothetical protein